MRLLICAGGTGGGVYPALSVLQAIRDRVEVLWIGGEGGMEANLVERSGIPFQAIPAAGVHGIGLRTLPRNLWQLSRGWQASRRILGEFKPDVLFFTGGYVAVPMALAGWKVPSLLYVPDIEPGLALKTLAVFADSIAITAEDSKLFFSRPNRITLSGYPVRAELAKWTRQAGRKELNLSDDSPVLLVLGGSKGARSINSAVLANLAALLELAQIVHITGELDWPNVKAQAEQLSAAQAARYHAYPYLHEQIGAALAAADLAVSRAGASTLGEYPLFGLPAVLVPYPYAWRYQKVNADYLVKHGAAILLEDEKLSENLLPVIQDLLHTPEKTAAMRSDMLQLSHPDAAVRIGQRLLALGSDEEKRP
ncbi:MAG TPA: undecaprenyldiphospho-muramoylpentapeptide beta-N-acetylglucosaminyltransferase [Anaerolineales bacterium]|nr:undecaprenyldiphospho-muramoylpentapeptide beta-N-acetylglucosaminyltransferase [Anaerolineales bacterium]